MHHLTGERLSLRLVEPRDAAYLYALRTDPKLNAHLSAPPPSVEAQAAWIEAYKERERRGEEYYFIVERLDGRPCGAVRVYGVTSDTFTWGSWILDEAKPPKAALDCAIQVYRFGFGVLGRDRAEFDVRLENERVLRFHRRFGAEEIGTDAQDAYFCLSRATFEDIVNGLETELRKE